MHERGHALGEVLGHALDREAEEVADLQGADDHRDSRGEAAGHRIGHELDEPPHPRHGHGHEEQSREDRGQEQAAQAETVRNGREHHHEGRGGARHLHARAAEQGDETSGHDGGVEAVLGRDAGSDGEGHRQRQGHDPDHGPRHEIRAEGLAAVAVGEGTAQRKGGSQPEAGSRRARSSSGSSLLERGKSRADGGRDDELLHPHRQLSDGDPGSRARGPARELLRPRGAGRAGRRRHRSCR